MPLRRGQRYSENPCAKGSTRNSDWRKETIFIEKQTAECYTGLECTCLSSNLDDSFKKSKNQKHCEKDDPCAGIRKTKPCSNIRYKPPEEGFWRNYNYTFYVEITVNLRKDSQLNSNKMIIVRSPYQHFKTPSAHANAPELLPESERIESTNQRTSMTINWQPPPIATGELAKFVILVREGTQRADGGKCVEADYHKRFKDEKLKKRSEEPAENAKVIKDQSEFDNYLEKLRLDCKGDREASTKRMRPKYLPKESKCLDKKVDEERIQAVISKADSSDVEHHNEFVCTFCFNQETCDTQCNRADQYTNQQADQVVDQQYESSEISNLANEDEERGEREEDELIAILNSNAYDWVEYDYGDTSNPSRVANQNS